MFFILFIILFLTASSIAFISITNSKNKSKDCLLKTPYTTECTNNKIKIIFPIDTPSSNNGKSCIDIISSLPSSLGYSNFTEINNKVEGSKDCRDCILSSPTVVPCDGTKVKLQYDITQTPLNGGIDCMTVVSSLPSSSGYSNFTEINDKVEGSKDCRDCILSSPTVVPCDGTKVKLQYDITQTPLNGGKDCLVVVPSLPSSSGYSNFTQIDNKVEGSKDCRDCVLSSPTVVPCDGTKVKLQYDITQTPINGGIDCMTTASSLPSSSGYSNFTQIDNKVEGSKDCRDCVLSSPTVVPCDGTKVKLQYDIIQTPLNDGIDCMTTASSLPSSSGYSNFTQIDNKVESSKVCRDCQVGFSQQLNCQDYSEKRIYNISQLQVNGGKTCVDIANQINGEINYDKFDITNNVITFYKLCNLQRVYGRTSLYYDIYRINQTKLDDIQNPPNVLTDNNNKLIVRFRDENGTTIGVNLPNDLLIYLNTYITSIDPNKQNWPLHEIPSAQSNDLIILYASGSLSYSIRFRSDNNIISYSYVGFLGSSFINYRYYSEVEKIA